MSLYAELLANIRQISLAASLPSPSDASTQVALTADCKTVELRHDSSVYQLTLPAKTALGGTLLPIQDRQKGTTTLAWRLPLDASSTPSSHQSDALPWSATDLDPSSAVACRQCSTVVLPAGAVNVWKDLPSENWAEMMEFWHCHKPDVPVGEKGEEGGDNTTKGYGANTRMMAQKRVGKVDLTYFLLDTEDCSGLEVRVFDILVSAGSLWFSYVRASRRRPASLSLQWQGHRYKCPIATPPLRPRMASVPSHTENGLLCHQASLASA